MNGFIQSEGLWYMTTFLTFANESVNLLQGEKILLGWMYIIGTNALCLLGVVLGLFVANRIWTI